MTWRCAAAAGGLVVMGAALVGAGRAAVGPAVGDNQPPQWAACTPDQAIPARHRYCEQRSNTAFMQALYGPLEGNASAPTIVEYDPSVRRNGNLEDHAMWNGRIGYVYLKVTPQAGGGGDGADGAGPGPGAAGAGQTEQARQPERLGVLGYRLSIRTTRSLLSSPGCTLVTQMVEPPEMSGPRAIRARCFLLDEGDSETHTAMCELLDGGEDSQTSAGLDEGVYVELYTDNSGAWGMSERRRIADLGPGEPARRFLDWAYKNAKEQGLNPPALPW